MGIRKFSEKLSKIGTKNKKKLVENAKKANLTEKKVIRQNAMVRINRRSYL